MTPPYEKSKRLTRYLEAQNKNAGKKDLNAKRIAYYEGLREIVTAVLGLDMAQLADVAGIERPRLYSISSGSSLLTPELHQSICAGLRKLISEDNSSPPKQINMAHFSRLGNLIITKQNALHGTSARTI